MLRLKKIGCVVIAMVIMFTLFGCPQIDVDRDYDGFSRGFNYKTHSGTYCAVRNEKTEFDVDDVTLDFYFGWYIESGVALKEEDEFGSVVLYFSNQTPKTSEIYDYYNIDNVFYMYEVTIQEFITTDYEITMSEKSGVVFNKSKKLTVPKEIFDRETRSFIFSVYFIFESNDEDNEFDIVIQSNIKIYYEYIDANKVLLY